MRELSNVRDGFRQGDSNRGIPPILRENTVITAAGQDTLSVFLTFTTVRRKSLWRQVRHSGDHVAQTVRPFVRRFSLIVERRSVALIS